jgi:hypothetical protein
LKNILFIITIINLGMIDSIDYESQIKAINEWMNQNQETIMYCTKLISSAQAEMEERKAQEEQEKPTITVRQYQPRKYRIRATEHERAVSRAYYIAHREEILEKRRLYHLKLKSKKNLNYADRPKKS